MGRRTDREANGTSGPGSARKEAPGKVFLGVHLEPGVHRRLYRLKALLEYRTGGFYGLGKLLARVIEAGLGEVEAEVSSDTGDGSGSGSGSGNSSSGEGR